MSRRYAVVLQSAELAGLSTVVVAPTSTRAQAARFRPVVTIRGRKTKVLVEQLQATDRSRFAKPVGHLALHEVEDVEEALRIILGLY